MFDFKNALGVPNWTEANAYPIESTLTELQWRWQFLRRRPDYRKAWVDHYDEVQKIFDDLDAQNCLGQGATREFYRSVGTASKDVCKPFGVSCIAAPWSQDPAPNLWRKTFGWSVCTVSPKVQIQSIVDQHDEWEADGIILLAFDLNRPFDEQIKTVRAHFQVAQAERQGAYAKATRQHRLKWPIYLRAIDARDQGATYADIYIELVLSKMGAAEYDASLDGNLAASGLQIFSQAQNLMFKVTS